VSATPVTGLGGESAPQGLSPRAAVAMWVAVALAIVLLLATAATRTQATLTLATVTGGLIVIAGRRVLLAWPTMLATIIIVILFIPIRRYTLGAGLPFMLEPYRLVIAMVLALWVAALLADPDVRVRSTSLEWPALAFGFCVLMSLVLNLGFVSSLSGIVLKQVTFFASYFFVMFFAASVVRHRRDLDFMVMLLVGGGAIVALCALYEWRSGVNLFNNLDRYIPILDHRSEGVAGTPERGGRVRAYASAQHAIALGAALVMLMPLAIYLYRKDRRLIWLGCAALMTMGALATGSRTAITMLVADLAVFLWLKRAATIRLLPMLLPLFIVCQAVMPGTLGTFRATLFPKEGLVAEEQGGEGTGTGRLKDVGPSLQQWGQKPGFGQGFGTRLTAESDGKTNAQILDDQWLSSLLEIGLFGVLSILWLIVRAVRRLKFRAKRDDSSYGWLLTAMAAAITSYAIGMITYDAFTFTQVTFLLFIVLGLSAAAIRFADAGVTDEPPPLARAA
jgi:hypothetical protein